MQLEHSLEICQRYQDASGYLYDIVRTFSLQSAPDVLRVEYVDVVGEYHFSREYSDFIQRFTKFES